MYQSAPAAVAWNQSGCAGFAALEGSRTMVQTQTVNLDRFPVAAIALAAQDGKDLLCEIYGRIGRGRQACSANRPVSEKHH